MFLVPSQGTDHCCTVSEYDEKEDGEDSLKNEKGFYLDTGSCGINEDALRNMESPY